MNTKIRLLPVIAVVAFGAFAVKAVSIAEAAGEAAAKSGQEQTAQAASTASQKPESGEVQLASAEPNAAPAEGEPSKPGDACPAPDLLAEQAGLSPYEIQVLRNLAERREELDARAEQLDTREMTISAAELRLNDQIDELKSLEGSILTPRRFREMRRRMKSRELPGIGRGRLVKKRRGRNRGAS